jgi:hypothetical protein
MVIGLSGENGATIDSPIVNVIKITIEKRFNFLHRKRILGKEKKKYSEKQLYNRIYSKYT